MRLMKKNHNVYMALIYRVWNAARDKKCSLVLKKGPELYNNFLLNANQKLNIQGVQLVFESDGTVIDDTLVLELCNDKVIMILEVQERWVEAKKPDLNNTNVPEIDHDNADKENKEVCNDNSQAAAMISDDTIYPDNVPKNIQRLKVESMDKYEINWKMFDQKTLDDLQKGTAAPKQQKKVVARIVDEIRLIDVHIPRHTFVRVAKLVVQKYPATFLDKKSDGRQRGNGYESVLSKLVNHNNYENRPLSKKSLLNYLNIPLRKIKATQSLKSGTINWQPEIFPDGETEETQEQKKNELLSFDNFDLTDPEVHKYIENLMAATFASQRLFLNREDPIVTTEDILQSWPCLFQQEYLFIHFQILTGTSISDAINQFNLYQPKIIAYGLMKSFITAAHLENTDPSLLAIKIIFHHSKENFEQTFITVAPDFAVEDLQFNDDNPCVLVINSEPPLYQVVKDGLICNSNILLTDLKQAMMFMMASYFSFNHHYSPNRCHFLEFVQRQFLEIYPSDGSSRSRKTSITKKVLTLQNIIEKIQVQEIAELSPAVA